MTTKKLPKNKQKQSADTQSTLPKLVFTMKEAAQMLGVAYLTVHRLCMQGKLRSVAGVRRRLFTRDELDRFIHTTDTQALTQFVHESEKSMELQKKLQKARKQVAA